jgi:hypothetical protein
VEPQAGLMQRWKAKSVVAATAAMANSPFRGDGQMRGFAKRMPVYS